MSALGRFGGGLKSPILGRNSDIREKRIKSASNLHQIANICAIHPPTSKSAGRETDPNSSVCLMTNSVSYKAQELFGSFLNIRNIGGNYQSTSPLDK